MSSTRRESTGAAGLFATDLDQAAVNRYFAHVLPVFGLLLLVTAGVVWGSVETGFATALFARLGFLTFAGLLVGQILVFLAARAFRELFPLNVLFGVVFAAFEGVIVAPTIAAFLQAGDAVVVAHALVITVAVFAGMSAIPLVTGRDFRFLGGILFAGLVGVVAVSVLSLFVGVPGPVQLAVDAFAVLLFAAFVLYDMSSILEGDFDAVSGAIMLYLDFVLIFVHLLRLLGELDG